MTLNCYAVRRVITQSTWASGLGISLVLIFGIASHLHAQASSDTPLPASDKTLFLQERVVITTDSGVSGIAPGTRVRLVQDNGATSRVTDGTITFDVSKDKLTGDAGVATLAARADDAAQRAAVDYMRQVNAALVQRQKLSEERARAARQLRAQEAKEAASKRSSRMYVADNEDEKFYEQLERDSRRELNKSYELEARVNRAEAKRQRRIQQFEAEDDQAEQQRRLNQQRSVLEPNEPQRFERQFTSSVKPNAYGLGVNSDEFGRPHVYRLEGGGELSPIFQDTVKRDAYGLGVHSDTFGRPVYDSQPK